MRRQTSSAATDADSCVTIESVELRHTRSATTPMVMTTLSVTKTLFCQRQAAMRRSYQSMLSGPSMQ